MAKGVTVSKWRQRVLAQEQSGLTQKAWCAREGLALSALALWRKRFREEDESGGVADGQALVPIVVREPVARELPEARCVGDGIVIESGLLRLRAAPGIDPHWLGALLRELRG